MLERAVIFMGADPYAEQGRKKAPLVRLGGLTLPERICHQLASKGLGEIVIVGDDLDGLFASSRRPAANIETTNMVGAIDRLLSWGEQPVAAIRSDRLYGNGLIEELVGGTPADKPTLWMDGETPIGMAALQASALAKGLQDVGTDAEGMPADRLQTVLTRLANGQEVSQVVPGDFWLPVERPEQVRPAVDRLFKSLTKPIDGWVSRNLNRPLSTRVTRLIVNLPIVPHPISFVVFAIGMSSVYFTLKGTYPWIALGGIIFHLASVLDGVDGELARVKFLATKTGALLDSILDHIIEVAYIGGVGWILTQQTGSSLYFGAFVATLFFALIATGITNYDQMTKTKTGAPMEVQFAFNDPAHKDKLWARIIDKIRFVFGRDFYALLFAVLTLLGFPHPIPLLAATATGIYFVVVLIGKLTKLGKKRRAPDGTGA